MKPEFDYVAEATAMINEKVNAFAKVPEGATHFSWSYGVLTFVRRFNVWEDPPTLSSLEEKVRRLVSYVWHSGSWAIGDSGFRLYPINEFPNKIREEVEHRLQELTC